MIPRCEYTLTVPAAIGRFSKYRAARYFTAILSNHVDPVNYCSGLGWSRPAAGVEHGCATCSAWDAVGCRAMMGGMEEWRPVGLRYEVFRRKRIYRKRISSRHRPPPRGKCCSFLDRIYMIVHDTSL